MESKVSYIPQLQKQLISLKQKANDLKLLQHQLTGFNSSDEYEAVSTMQSITDMQIEAAKKALIF